MNVALQILPQAAQADMPQPAFHVWREGVGQVSCEFFRVGAGYLQRFPGRADFEISADGKTVVARPATGISAHTLQHLYLNQAMPMALSRQGRLVLHGSCVAFLSGAAKQSAAFIAPSGAGKSTLTAYLAAQGASFLGDDVLQIHCEAGAPWALPSQPRISLWADSRQALLPCEAAYDAAVGDNGKAHVPASPTLSHCLQPQRLARVFFLGTGTADGVSIQPLSPAEACIELSRHTFVVDVEDQALLAASFAEVSRLAQLPMHFRLDYPRQYSHLPQVRSAIQAHLAEAHA